VEEFTAQPDAVESSTEYEMAPLPEVVAGADGGKPESGIVIAVVGDHDTVGVPRLTAKL
jgi:hypothetical protein